MKQTRQQSASYVSSVKRDSANVAQAQQKKMLGDESATTTQRRRVSANDSATTTQHQRVSANDSATNE
jgi:hypothetical protein